MNKKISLMVIALLIINLSIAYATPIVESAEIDELNYLESYEDNQNSLDNIRFRGLGGDDYWVVAKKGSPILQTKRFVKFLTGSWAKADNYNYSETVGYSWSLSGNYKPAMKSALSFSFTKSESKSHSIGTSIPANKNRYSKLSFAADYNKYYVKMAYKDYWTARTLKTVSGVVVQEPTEETYLLVVYK